MKTPVRMLKQTIKKTLVQLNLLDPFRKPFREIEFETTTFCNRNCEYCPNSKNERVGSEDGKYMKKEVFEKLLSDLVDMGFQGIIAPHLYGEPLTDPRLVNWVSRIRRALPACIIKIVTNGDFLDEQKYNELLSAGVDCFWISKHSPKLPSVLNDLLNSMPKNSHSKRIKVLDFYEDYRKGQKLLNTRGGEIKLKKKLRHPVCCVYVTYPVIDTFGNVVLCCNDYHSRYISGNIVKCHLIDIWQDSKNIILRKRIYKGHFDLSICKNCWV